VAGFGLGRSEGEQQSNGSGLTHAPRRQSAEMGSGDLPSLQPRSLSRLFF
jgi:hypothetical protein